MVVTLQDPPAPPPPAETPAPPPPPPSAEPLHDKITARLLEFAGYPELNKLHNDLKQVVKEVAEKDKSLADQAAASSLTAEILRYDHLRRQACNDTIRFVAVAVTVAVVVICMLTWGGETLKSLFGRVPVVPPQKATSTTLEERLGTLVALSNRAEINDAVKRCANRLKKVGSEMSRPRGWELSAEDKAAVGVECAGLLSPQASLSMKTAVQDRIGSLASLKNRTETGTTLTKCGESLDAVAKEMANEGGGVPTKWDSLRAAAGLNCAGFVAPRE